MCQLDQSCQKSNFTQCVYTGYIGSLTLFLNTVYYKLLVVHINKIFLVLYCHDSSVAKCWWMEWLKGFQGSVGVYLPS